MSLEKLLHSKLTNSLPARRTSSIVFTILFKAVAVGLTGILSFAFFSTAFSIVLGHPTLLLFHMTPASSQLAHLFVIFVILLPLHPGITTHNDKDFERALGQINKD